MSLNERNQPRSKAGLLGLGNIWIRDGCLCELVVLFLGCLFALSICRHIYFLSRLQFLFLDALPFCLRIRIDEFTVTPFF